VKAEAVELDELASLDGKAETTKKAQ